MHDIMIAGRKIGKGEKPFVIAEMSGNHNQSLDTALRIVDEAARAGAHALKIQTYTADTMTLDVETEEGKHVLELYLRTRNLFMFQFEELGKTLRMRAGRMYANAPALQKGELIAINGLMSKLLLSPFVPQGNFGNYVLVV